MLFRSLGEAPANYRTDGEIPRDLPHRSSANHADNVGPDEAVYLSSCEERVVQPLDGHPTAAALLHLHRRRAHALLIPVRQISIPVWALQTDRKSVV